MPTSPRPSISATAPDFAALLKPSILAALALLVASCGSAAAPPETGPQWPQQTGRVVDQAGVLSALEQTRLSSASADLERDVGPQLVIVTVPSLQDYPIEDFSIRLARSWQIGSREHGDGLMMLVAPNERRVRIEVGTGLEKRVTDPYAYRVIHDRMLPRFRENDLPGGIVAGSDALIERLRSHKSDAEIAREDGVVT